MAPSKHVKNNFSSALKRARKSSGFSQEDFSVVSSRTYVSALERGLKSPTLNKVDDLSETMDIHPLTLLSLAYLGDLRRSDVNALFVQVTRELTKVLGIPNKID